MSSSARRAFSRLTLPAWVLVLYGLASLGSTIDWITSRLPSLLRIGVSRLAIYRNLNLSVWIMTIGFAWLTAVIYWPELSKLLQKFGTRRKVGQFVVGEVLDFRVEACEVTVVGDPYRANLSVFVFLRVVSDLEHLITIVNFKIDIETGGTHFSSEMSKVDL